MFEMALLVEISKSIRNTLLSSATFEQTKTTMARGKKDSKTPSKTKTKNTTRKDATNEQKDDTSVPVTPKSNISAVQWGEYQKNVTAQVKGLEKQIEELSAQNRTIYMSPSDKHLQGNDNSQSDDGKGVGNIWTPPAMRVKSNPAASLYSTVISQAESYLNIGHAPTRQEGLFDSGWLNDQTKDESNLKKKPS